MIIPPPSELFDVLTHRAAQVDSDGIAAGLTNVDFILQVSVFDTNSTIDSTAPSGLNTVEGVKAQVLEVVKGQNLPTCNDTLYRAHLKGANPLNDQPCIAFQYMQIWLQSIQDERGLWQTGQRPPWATPGNDYIVFLKYTALGTTGRSPTQPFVRVGFPQQWVACTRFAMGSFTIRIMISASAQTLQSRIF